MSARAPVRARGLYRNGGRWWLRVKAPSGRRARRSTGTTNLVLANRVNAMLASLEESRPQWDLLELAAAGTLPLGELYNAYAAGALHTLRQELVARPDDPDLEPLVGEWERTHLPARDLTARCRT
ncbi:MAG: hypothetical protein ACREQ5_33875, partial [Candidatus Dormibacteria bacterium]